MTKEEWDNLEKEYPSNTPDKDESWCITNCKKGYKWKHVEGMVDSEGCQCPRISCKEFWEASDEILQQLNK